MPRLSKKYKDYSSYTERILREVDGGKGVAMTRSGRHAVNEFLRYSQERLVKCIVNKARSMRKKTIRDDDVLGSSRVIMPRSLYKGCRRCSMRVLDTFHAYSSNSTATNGGGGSGGEKQKRVTSTTKAGLIFTPSRMGTFIKRECPDLRISLTGCITGAATLQHIATLLLSKSTTIRGATNKRRICEEHVLEGVRTCFGLSEFMQPVLKMYAGEIANYGKVDGDDDEIGGGGDDGVVKNEPEICVTV